LLTILLDSKKPFMVFEIPLTVLGKYFRSNLPQLISKKLIPILGIITDSIGFSWPSEELNFRPI